MRYVARDGDTISEVAIALLGSDSQDHRDAVAAVNVSLQSNPDRVLTGQTYSIDTTASDEGNGDVATRPIVAVTAAATTPATTAKAADAVLAPAGGPKLKYIARTGDTIAVLAGNLLGGDTAVNREAIIAANETLLRVYPSHLIAGQSYTIAAPAGMSSDPDAPQAKTTPSGQGDADDAVQQGSGRSLRYTAKAGDTVSSLAAGAARQRHAGPPGPDRRVHPRLKRDPDHLEAGRTY